MDEQIQQVVDRLAPVHARLLALLENSDVSPVMPVVRHFNDADGDGAAISGAPTTRQTSQLGWSLSVQILDFLASTRTMLDVDEYDFGDGDNDDAALASPVSAGS